MYAFQENFMKAMNNLRGSRPASTQDEDARVTEMINRVLVSRPTITNNKEPEIIELQEYARFGKTAVSVPTSGINKVKEIHEFINGSIIELVWLRSSVNGTSTKF